MIKILRDCLGSRYVKLLAIVAILVALGLLAWGVAPKLIISALPLLGIAACLIPCLLALYWLRRSSPATTTPTTTPGDTHLPSR
jgi:hypothetical protein